MCKTYFLGAVIALTVFSAASPLAAEQAVTNPPKPADSCLEAPSDGFGEPMDLKISEMVLRSRAAHYLNGNSWIELQNTGKSPICLGVYSLKTDTGEPVVLPAVTVQSGEFQVIEVAEGESASTAEFLPWNLKETNSVSLHANGKVIDTLSWKNEKIRKGRAFGRLDGANTILHPTPGSGNVPYELFSDSKVFTVKINMSDASYNDLVTRPLLKRWYPADLEFNGAVVEDVRVRAKGTSTLRHIGSLKRDHKSFGRYSFRIAFHKGKSGKFMGMKRLDFNSGYGDPTLMRDAVAYRVLREAGVPASEVSFVDLWVGDKHLGVYQMIEPVDGEYVEKHFPKDHASDQKGNLYKAFSSLQWQEGQTLPQFTRGRPPQLALKTNRGTPEAEAGHKTLMAFLESINSGAVDMIDTDNLTRYIAAMTLISNYDSYFANRGNYFLYEHRSAKRFAMIPWDFNLALGRSIKKGKPCEDPVVLINHPTIPPLDERPIIARVLERNDLRAQYHKHLDALLKNIFNPDDLGAFIAAKRKLLDPYVKNDPTGFYSYDEWQQSFTGNVSGTTDQFGKAGALLPFIQARHDNVKRQLSGEITAGSVTGGPCP